MQLVKAISSALLAVGAMTAPRGNASAQGCRPAADTTRGVSLRLNGLLRNVVGERSNHSATHGLLLCRPIAGLCVRAA